MALIGLAIYGASLRVERHPSYLYLSLAAFALSVVATLDVVIGPERPLEVYLGRMLGYPGKPPFPFHSIQMSPSTRSWPSLGLVLEAVER